jgi:hypothetical protein
MTPATPRALLLAALVMSTTGCGSGCGGNHGGGAHYGGSSHSSSHSSSSYSGSSHSGSSSSHGSSSSSHGSTASNSRSGSSGSGSHGSGSRGSRGSHSGGSGAAGDATGWDGSGDSGDYGYSVPPAPVAYGPDVGPPTRAETPCQRAQREWLEQYPGVPRPFVLRCGPQGEWGPWNPNARPDQGDLPSEAPAG